jgi:hypothetical protein
VAAGCIIVQYYHQPLFFVFFDESEKSEVKERNSAFAICLRQSSCASLGGRLDRRSVH